MWVNGSGPLIGIAEGGPEGHGQPIGVPGGGLLRRSLDHDPDQRFRAGRAHQDPAGGAQLGLHRRHLSPEGGGVGQAGPVARWQDLGAYRTLAQLPTGAEAAASLDPRLATLLDQADGQVITTLETYLDLAGDAKASAERLSLHRGTLYYRLQKAERIAGVDLRNGCDRLALHLGFKLARLIGLYPKQAHEPAAGP